MNHGVKGRLGPWWKPAIVITALLFTALFTQAAEVYRLEDLVSKLKETNLLIKISELDTRIARQKYRSARALPNPELELSRGKAEIPGEIERADIWDVGVKLSIPNPLYRGLFLKSQKGEIKTAEINALMTRLDMVKELKGHCFRLQYQQKLAVLLQEKMERLSEVSRIIKARVSIGETKEIEYLRATVELQKIRSELFRVEKTLLAEKTGINEVLNNTLAKDFKLEEDFGFKPAPGLEKKVTQLIEKSPLVMLRHNELSAKKAGHQAQRYSLIEGVELFGERGQEPDAKIWKVGIGISVPIFNFKRAEVKKARLEREKARVELEHARKHHLADVTRKTGEVMALEKEIETFTGTILREGEQNVTLSERLYREGEISLVEYLDAQNSFFEIKARYYQAIIEWKILKTELEAMLGVEL